MIFTNHELPESLAAHIQAIFHFKDFEPDHSKERVIPTGHLFLIFELDHLTRHTFDNETLTSNGTYKNVWFSGQHHDFITISAHQKSEMLVVQFKSVGAYPFVNTPISLTTNKVVAAEQLFGENVLTLRDELVATKLTSAKFEKIEFWLKTKYKDGLDCPDDILKVVNNIHTSTNQNLASATTDYPFSAKHLINQFKKYIGLTPKLYHRIIRFNSILHKINSKSPVYWSDIAYQCGYADQSHFIKEFKRFSGFNPGEFISNHKDEANFFPLDRQG